MFQNTNKTLWKIGDARDMNMLLAQSASLDGAMSEGLGIIAKFLYIIAVIVIEPLYRYHLSRVANRVANRQLGMN